MKIKHVKKLLDSMSTKNKDYDFVLAMYSFGTSELPIYPFMLKKLGKLMDKKGIKYQPSLWQRLKWRTSAWWLFNNPFQKKYDFSGISRTTFVEPSPSREEKK